MIRVLVTRPAEQADEFVNGLKAAGFEPVCFPVIEIRPFEQNAELEQALEELASYDWIVFTSVNGVEIVLDLLPEPATLPRVAAIGPKTAQALRVRGIEPDIVPDEYVAEAILPGLGDLHGKRVLLPRAEIARKALPDAIRSSGGIAHEIAVYRTLPAQPDASALAALRGGVDWITFTSPSTVDNFLEIIRSYGLDPRALPGNPKVACIGPITEIRARQAGFEVALVAGEYTADGLIHALQGAVAT